VSVDRILGVFSYYNMVRVRYMVSFDYIHYRHSLLNVHYRHLANQYGFLIASYLKLLVSFVPSVCNLTLQDIEIDNF